MIWNGIVHLPTCFQSIEKQTNKNFSILVVDNGSLDGSVAWIRVNVPHAYILQNNRNLGFADAHNQAIRLSKAPYVLCLNQDFLLEPQWIESAVTYLDAHPEVASYGTRIVRYSYNEQALTGVDISGIIDSTGLRVTRSRHAFDRDSGRRTEDRAPHSEFVFGLSAACVMYRRSALESVRYQDEYFDDDFFAYKEDVDLSWRLQRAGWSAWYDDTITAYHHRSIRGQNSVSSLKLAQSHRHRTAINTRLSYRNHQLMLLKNETAGTFWPDSIQIVWYEFRKFVFLLFTGPKTLNAWVDVWRLAGRMRKKKAIIRQHARRSAGEVRQWFISPTHS